MRPELRHRPTVRHVEQDQFLTRGRDAGSVRTEPHAVNWIVRRVQRANESTRSRTPEVHGAVRATGYEERARSVKIKRRNRPFMPPHRSDRQTGIEMPHAAVLSDDAQATRVPSQL